MYSLLLDDLKRSKIWRPADSNSSRAIEGCTPSTLHNLRSAAPDDKPLLAAATNSKDQNKPLSFYHGASNACDDDHAPLAWTSKRLGDRKGPFAARCRSASSPPKPHDKQRQEASSFPWVRVVLTGAVWRLLCDYSIISDALHD